MRAFVPNYQMVTASSLVEALGLLAQQPGQWKPFAGGTDLMVLLEANKLPHTNYVNIWNLSELRNVEVASSQVTIGALASYSQIQEHEILQAEFPMLCQAAKETGGLAIQNRGTLGGNIANASPAADSPPALLAYGAAVELVSVSGTRLVPYKDFHTGYKQMNLRADELLARIHLPRSQNNLTHYYRKVGTRKAQAISKVCFAGVGRVENDLCIELRIALGSVAPVPLRCTRTEDVIRHRALDDKVKADAIVELSREIAPISDIRSTSDYRLRVSQNLLKDFLERLKHLDQPV